MKIHLRSYCYGCRQGSRWARSPGQRRHEGRPVELREHCIWRRHRFDWEWFIEEQGVRLATRQGLVSYSAALESAERKLLKLRIALGGAA